LGDNIANGGFSSVFYAYPQSQLFENQKFAAKVYYRDSLIEKG